MRLARSPVAPNRTKTAGRAAGFGCWVMAATPPSYIPAPARPAPPFLLAKPHLPVQHQRADPPRKIVRPTEGSPSPGPACAEMSGEPWQVGGRTDDHGT